MSKGQKNKLKTILISAGIYLFALVFPFKKVFPEQTAEILQAVLYLASYLIIGRKVLMKAARNIRNGQVFDENALEALANSANGVPRLLNKLANSCLMIASAKNCDVVDSEVVMQAVNDCELV